MNLREALELACSGGSVTPGAINGNSHVYYDDEAQGTSNRPWVYVPDITAKRPEGYSLADDQLEQIVLFAHSHEWEPTSNLLVEGGQGASAPKRRYTLIVTEIAVRRYVIDAESDEQAIMIGKSPLVDLRDRSGKSTFERVLNMGTTVHIVNREDIPEEMTSLEG